MAFVVDALDHLVVNVRDVARWARRTSMKFSRQRINPRRVSATHEEWFPADREAAGSDDLCFLTSRTTGVDHLRACGVAIIEGPTDKRVSSCK